LRANTIGRERTGPKGYSHPDLRPRKVRMMEQNSPAEELPALYRAILDRVADLESDGDRAEAARVRATATRIYSRAWDDSARRGLTDLLRKSAPPSDETVPAQDAVRRRRVAPSRG
jgi:hypothetical protein